ncbi:MAG: hypothetical protein QOG64_1485 [Acidimicrobiaceae bacterium]|nr:hypothetical protein [Acidimicrobiaceae bacterium]
MTAPVVTRGRGRRRASPPPPVVPAEDDLVPPPGLSYVCRRCDVYGYLNVGERRACWCCSDNDRLARR